VYWRPKIEILPKRNIPRKFNRHMVCFLLRATEQESKRTSVGARYIAPVPFATRPKGLPEAPAAHLYPDILVPPFLFPCSLVRLFFCSMNVGGSPTPVGHASAAINK
jgi:hypothetical protein